MTLRVVSFYFVLLPIGPDCCECDLYFMCCSVNGSVCLVCSVFDRVCELFGESIRNVFGSGGYFLVECYGSV